MRSHSIHRAHQFSIECISYNYEIGEKEEFGGASVTLTGQGSTLYQTYAFAVSENAMGQLQINCPNKADLQTSQEVVANIVFNKLFL